MPQLPRSKVIGIVGSRRRNDRDDFHKVYDEFFKIYLPGDSIVSGGCKEGADRFAEILARDEGISIIIHYPRKENLDKELEKINPRAAWAKVNYARNTLIAQDCDILIALIAEDRTGGYYTEDTIKKAVKLGKKIIYA